MTTSSAARSDEAPAEAPAPAELAARLASKLCHDFVSPAGAIVSGLDLLNDPSARDMRDDALALIDQSARKLLDLLAFARIAYGAPAGVDELDAAEIESLARRLFAHARATLEWSVAPGSLPKIAAQSLLNLAQLGAGALPLGGQALISIARDAGALRLETIARGPKARLHQEVRDALEGRHQGEGLPGRWAPAAFLYAIVSEVGGAVEAEADEGRVTLAVTIPL